MAKDRDSDVSGTSQSKRPNLNRFDSGDQTQHHQHQLASHTHHRSKSQKHIVGGGGRVHPRVPSSKALLKYHGTNSTTKVNRRRSLSPDQDTTAAAADPPLASGHRRATSDLRLTNETSASSHIRKNSSQTSLGRNRSQVEIGKKTKSSTNLKRSLSNPAVQKLRSSNSHSKVHFNLGGDGEDEPDLDEDGQEDEWVDASASASPLLSRRGSTATGVELADDAAASGAHNLASTGDVASPAHSLSRNSLASHSQILTSRILKRTPSHGAPPMMSPENISVAPRFSRQDSPDFVHDTSMLSGTSRLGSHVRPGSSGRQELTSRFVGDNNPESGPGGRPLDSFSTAVLQGGISRAAVNGKPATNGPRRPRSAGNLARTNGHQYYAANGAQSAAPAAAAAAEPLTDEEDVENGALAAGRHSGSYVVPADTSRTQQKLDLQRASSTLESAHSHPEIAMRSNDAMDALMGFSTFDHRDSRWSKLLTKTGSGYLVVRRYQNPIARSISRLAQLPGWDKQKPIPRSGTGSSTRPSTSHSKKGSDLGGGRSGLGLPMRDPGVSTGIGGQSTAIRRSAPPRIAFASSSQLTSHSISSSLDTDDEVSRIHERQALSGTSLVNGEDDASTLALLRNMWDKNMDLSASQD